MPTHLFRNGGLDPALLWNPFSMFDQLERAAFGATDWFEWPAFDVEDTDDETLLIADVPGMTDDDIALEVTGQTLIVRGQRKPSGRGKRRPYGSFERHFRLAEGYDLDHVSAELADGVLTIKLPKTAKAKPRRIKVQRGLGDRVKGLLKSGKE